MPGFATVDEEAACLTLQGKQVVDAADYRRLRSAYKAATMRISELEDRRKTLVLSGRNQGRNNYSKRRKEYSRGDKVNEQRVMIMIRRLSLNILFLPERWDEASSVRGSICERVLDVVDTDGIDGATWFEVMGKSMVNYCWLGREVGMVKMIKKSAEGEKSRGTCLRT